MFWELPAENTFQAFHADHLAALAAVALLSVCAFIFSKRLRAFKGEFWIRAGFVALMVAGLALEEIWTATHGIWTAKLSLPISICNFTEVFAVYMLLKPSKAAFGYVYFGMVAATQALLTPTLSFGFPYLSYFCFFVKHGLLIAAPLYMIAVHGYRPKYRQLWKYIAALLVALPFVYLINWLVGGNYWFITDKTPSTSLLTYLGPYPWFLVSLLGVAIALCHLYYLPLAIISLRKRRALRVLGK